MDKVYGGTLNSKSLCTTCKYYRKRILRSGVEASFCSESFDRLIELKAPVVECNDYTHANSPSLYDMRKLAWILRTNASGKAIGFMQRKDFVDKFGEDEANKGLE